MREFFALPADWSYDVLVAPSVCLEETLTFMPEEEDISKLPVTTQTRIAGTSFNLALALNQIFNRRVKLLGLIGQNPTETAGAYLQTRMPPGIDFHPLPFADQTSVAHVLIAKNSPLESLTGKILSTKGVCINPEAAQAEIREQVRLCRPAVRIASGVTLADAPLALALLEKEGGLRILNPRLSLIRNKETMFSLVRLSDLLVLNHEELAHHLGRPVEETKVALAEVEGLHQAGVKNVMITCNQHGLFFSGQGLSLRKEAFRYGEVKNPTGAGDALLSGLVGAIFMGLDLDKGLDLARIYAGLKLTFPGGSSLPPKDLFEKILSQH